MLRFILARLFGVEDKYIYAYTFDGIIGLHITRGEMAVMMALKTLAGLFPGRYHMSFERVIETITLRSSRDEVSETMVTIEVDANAITLRSAGPEGGERIGPWETSLEEFPRVFIEDILARGTQEGNLLITHDPEAFIAEKHMGWWHIAEGNRHDGLSHIG